MNLEPQTTIHKWLFQLDDSKSLYRKWLEITISIHEKTVCLGFQVTIHEITSSEKNAAYQDHTRSPSCSPLQLQRTTRLVKTQKPHENIQAGVLFINGAEVLQSTNPVRSC